MSLTITLYNYDDEYKRIDKVAGLSGGLIKTGDQLDIGQTMLDLSVVISSTTTPNYNYCRISEFNRYYFINNISWLGGTAFQLDLHVDVLYTYADEIKNLTAYVTYSGSGKWLTIDPRMPVNATPVLEETNVPINSADQRAELCIVLRYQYANPVQGAVGTRAAIMSQTAFYNFMTSYRALTEAQRVAVGRQIVDVSAVLLNSFAIAPTNTLPKTHSIQFWVDDWGLGGFSGYINVSVDPSNVLYAYIITTPADNKLIPTLEYVIDNAPDNDLINTINSNYKVTIPYIGEFQYNLFKAGIVEAVESVNIVIAYDAFANAYYVSPAYFKTGDDASTLDADELQVYPVTTSYGLVLDTEYNNAQWQIIAQGMTTLGVVANGLYGGEIGASIQAMGNYSDYVSRNYLDAASSWKARAVAGGTPAYTALIDALQILVEKTWFNNLGDLATYQIEYGMPDSETRSLGLLSGYFEVGKVMMTGFDTATKREVDEIESLLKQGVIM